MKILKNNFSIKLLALFLASLLWIFVYVSEARTVKLPFSIPIETRGLDESLVAVISPEESNAYLTVIAEKNSWEKLTPEDFAVYVDLLGKKEGNYSVTVQYSAKNPNVSITEINPSVINIAVEQASTKLVSVVAKYSGVPASGLVVRETKFEPDKVTIKGPKSIIDKTAVAEALIELNGESSNIEKNVAIIGKDVNSNEIAGLIYDPEEVKASISIGKGGLSKQLIIKPAFNGTPAKGKWISGFTVDPSNALTIISGENSDLKYIETNKIDVSGLTESKDFQVSLNLPEGVSLNESIEKVKVSVEISGQSTTKEVVLGLKYSSLTNLKVSAISPNQVSGLVSGSSDLLAGLDANNSFITFNLANYNSPGTYTLDITNSMVTLPSGVSLVSYVPSALSITLVNK